MAYKPLVNQKSLGQNKTLSQSQKFPVVALSPKKKNIKNTIRIATTTATVTTDPFHTSRSPDGAPNIHTHKTPMGGPYYIMVNPTKRHVTKNTDTV